jgi:hypothetical protein
MSKADAPGCPLLVLAEFEFTKEGLSGWDECQPEVCGKC